MSRTLDAMSDDTPHGTVEGYRQGCRSSHCPAGDEHGLSCVLANTYAAGNWQYMKAIQRGLNPREIAALLDLHPAAEKPAPKKTKHETHDDVPAHIEPEKEQTMNEVQKPAQREIRAWARENNIDVPPRGTLPRAIIDAFNARGKGVQASDVKPTPTPEPTALPEGESIVLPKHLEDALPKPPDAVPDAPDWSLPLASDDLRSIADAIDALEKVPRSVVEIDRIPVLRPGGEEVIGDIVTASGFEDDPWLDFTPRGAA